MVDVLERVATPLYAVIDPEALDSIITDNSPVTILFSYEGYHIRIDGDQLAIY